MLVPKGEEEKGLRFGHLDGEVLQGTQMEMPRRPTHNRCKTEESSRLKTD